jgi:geranylgeranyl diphosphate synthase type I
MMNENAEVYSLYKSLATAVDDTIGVLLRRVEPLELRESLVHGAFGGKRVRPVLTMISCAAVGGTSRDALHAATAIELLHTSSLIHDDIMDCSPMRRGVPTIHTLYGNSIGILAGDTLIALAIHLLQGVPSRNKDRILGRFTNAFLHTCEGQGYDLLLSRGQSTSIQSHRKMVEKKTALLMEAAASIGAMIGTSNEDQIQALGRFGFKLGMAFQAKDDLLDVVGDEMRLGKPVRADHENGKLTFLNAGSPRWGNGDQPAVAVAVSQVEEFIGSACLELDVLPPTPARGQLRTLAEFLLLRDR